MKKTTFFLIFGLVLSVNLAFSQSKFSLVGGSKYYTSFDYEQLYYNRPVGLFVGAYYHLNKRNSIAIKLEKNFTYDDFGTNIISDNATNQGLAWRYIFVKRSKFDVFVESGVSNWFFKYREFARFTDDVVDYILEPYGYAPSKFLAIEQILGTNFHLTNDLSLSFQAQLYNFKVRNTHLRRLDSSWIKQYGLNLAVEYHF